MPDETDKQAAQKEAAESAPFCAHCASRRKAEALHDSPLWQRLTDPFSEYGRTALDDELDDPRRGQAAELNRG